MPGTQGHGSPRQSDAAAIELATGRRSAGQCAAMSTIQTDRPATPVAVGERPVRRARPTSEYWDYLTASWRAAPTLPQPRRGD
jgi:hypothetical protein